MVVSTKLLLIFELWFMNYDVGNRSIEAEAELGGLEKMRNFLIGLPLLLGVLFLILFGILFQEKRGAFVLGVSL